MSIIVSQSQGVEEIVTVMESVTKSPWSLKNIPIGTTASPGISEDILSHL